MLFIIKDHVGDLIQHTLSYSEETAWENHLGFEPVDDQWAYQRQKMLQKGYRCVAVELKEVGLAEESKEWESLEIED